MNSKGCLFQIECGQHILQKEAIKASLISLKPSDLTWHLRFIVCKGFPEILFGSLLATLKKIPQLLCLFREQLGVSLNQPSAQLDDSQDGFMCVFARHSLQNSCTRACFALAAGLGPWECFSAQPVPWRPVALFLCRGHSFAGDIFFHLYFKVII